MSFLGVLGGTRRLTATSLAGLVAVGVSLFAGFSVSGGLTATRALGLVAVRQVRELPTATRPLGLVAAKC